VHLPVPTDFLIAANEEPHFFLFHMFLPANFEFDVSKSPASLKAVQPAITWCCISQAAKA
jgi:hypothetical protein